MIIYTTTCNAWIIEVATGDEEMPWIQMGMQFQTEQAAKANLRTWREELQDSARVVLRTYESWTAHEG